MERVFDICHGCRRCFNLCDSFPRLFDMIDEGPTGELDGVPREKYAEVTEACTLCDMCFMTKCPYVPPHPFNVDFPHVLLRHRAALRKKEGGEFVREQLGETDRNGKLAKPVARHRQLGDEASRTNPSARLMEATLGDRPRRPMLPNYQSKTAKDRLKATKLAARPGRPGVRPAQGRALFHLFRRIQHAGRPPKRRRRVLAQAGRRGAPRLSGLLRHAPARGGRYRRGGRAGRRRPRGELLPLIDAGL